MNLEGVVVFKLANKGSHSENINPYLYLGNGEFKKIFFEGDNPFENKTLKKYDSMRVVVSGDYDDYNTFVITTINRQKEQEEYVLCEEKKAKDAEEIKIEIDSEVKLGK